MAEEAYAGCASNFNGFHSDGIFRNQRRCGKRLLNSSRIIIPERNQQGLENALICPDPGHAVIEGKVHRPLFGGLGAEQFPSRWPV
jgi:hypothetical protein